VGPTQGSHISKDTWLQLLVMQGGIQFLSHKFLYSVEKSAE